MLAEIALPMVIPNKRWLGIAMLSVAGVAFAVAIGWSPSNVRPPNLAIFIPVALAGSVIAALSFEWRRDAALKGKLIALSVALREFQVECEARLARASTTPTFADAKKWGTTEFWIRFSSPINQLKDSWSLVVPFGAEYSEMLLGTHLAKPSAERLASAASNELSKASERLPNPKSWIKRNSLLRSILLCLGLAAVAWSALFIAGKVVATEGGSGSQAVMLNVDNSKSPFSIPSGTNQLFAASTADRDTELILPPATGSGDMHTVKKTDSNLHQIKVTPHGSDTIDGAKESIKITIQNDVVRFVDRDRTQWAIE